MANEKEIRTKIASITSTKKITKAMEMVAASKMRRAQERMRASQPYAEKIRHVVGHVVHSSLEYRHPWLIERETVKSIGVIVISSDRGLCGGLNINLFKSALLEIKKWQDQGVDVQITAIGGKAITFFKRHFKLASQVSHLGDTPHPDDLIGTVKVMLDAYEEGQIDKLLLVENKFVNTMTQDPTVSELIPASPVDKSEVAPGTWDYIYEPEAKDVLTTMLKRYVESQIYQAVIENIACEMSARMIAMKSASDNAGDLIKELRLAYNKARQASITQEISEIVGGAAAVS